ncbi:hypothetical protein LCGC14_3037330, partial [marine sediment metagenome]
MRTIEEIRAQQQALLNRQLRADTFSLPPGFQVGCKLTLTAGVITIGVGALNVRSSIVKFTIARTVLGEDWVVSQIPGGTYYIYVDVGGTLTVDALEPAFDSDYYADYHQYKPDRYLGKILTEAGTGTYLQVVNGGAIVTGDVDTTTLETVFAIIAFNEATPVHGSHRVYIDRNEVAIQIYDSVAAAWD